MSTGEPVQCTDPMCTCRGGPCAECPEGRALATTLSDELLDEAAIAAAEVDGNMTERDREEFINAWLLARGVSEEDLPA